MVAALEPSVNIVCVQALEIAPTAAGAHTCSSSSTAACCCGVAVEVLVTAIAVYILSLIHI